jgi:cytochrome c556
MKRILTLALIVAAGTLVAQSDKDYETWMKTVGGNMGPMRKAIDAKAGSEAAEAAKKIETQFGHIEKFWAQRSASDAVKWSQDAQAAARDIASAATSGSDANAAFGRLGATCKGCHAVHREKAPDGSWRIK